MEEASGVRLPRGRCAPAGNHSRAMTGRRGKARVAREVGELLFVSFSGPAGESRGGGGGALRSFPASRGPHASPRPPPPPAASPAPRGRKRRAPPTLSRSLASPVQALSGGGGGGAEGIAAMERRENPAGARQSVESHGHIKMPY